MATALDRFLEPLEQAISAATAVGKRLVAAACRPSGVSLFEDNDKRKELAGALLLDKAGDVFGAVPHAKPIHAGRLRVSRRAASDGTHLYEAQELTTLVGSAYLGVFSVPVAGTIPSASYTPIMHGVPPNDYSIELVPAEPISEAMVVSVASGRLPPRPLSEAFSLVGIPPTPWVTADQAAAQARVSDFLAAAAAVLIRLPTEW